MEGRIIEVLLYYNKVYYSGHESLFLYLLCVDINVHYTRIYGSKPPRTRAKPCKAKDGLLLYNVVDNKCYIPMLE